MHTKEMASEYRLTLWAQVMRERGESGLSVRAFCRESGIHENVYYSWQRKLRRVVCEQAAQSPPVPCFAEVRLEPALAHPAQPEPGDIPAGRLCFDNTQNQIKAHNFAKLCDEVMSPSYIFLINEQEESMSDVYLAIYRMHETKTVQKYGRFYTLIIIRWLAEILCSLAQTASFGNDIQAFYGLEDHYRGNYIVGDQALKNRKIWPILKNY